MGTGAQEVGKNGLVELEWRTYHCQSEQNGEYLKKTRTLSPNKKEQEKESPAGAVEECGNQKEKLSTVTVRRGEQASFSAERVLKEGHED